MLEDLQRAEGVLKHLQGLMVGDWFAHDTCEGGLAKCHLVCIL
jgi:hypothetical protein